MAERGGGIRGRIVLLVSLAALVPLGTAALVAGSRMDRLEAELVAQRELLARALAGRVEAAMEGELAGLAGLAADARVDAGDGNDAGERSVLAARPRSRLLERVFLAARDGRLLAQDPAADWPPCPLSAALSSRRPRVESGAGGRRWCLLVPAQADGETVLAGGVIDGDGATWPALLRPPGSAASVTLLDASGSVVAASGPAPDGIARTVTTVPLSLGEWRLSLTQPEEPAVAEARALRARVAVAAPLAVGLVLVLAWGAARSLTRPLAVLSEAAGRMAVGHIEEPLPELGGDEVGQLGRSLEAMRGALERALEAAARAHAELERRVEERTRELETASRQLRERERARRELLHKLITAQEDERRRIARELHDESCQTLSLLAMNLDDLRGRIADPSAAGPLASARALAVRTLEEVHRLIFDLRPSLLDDLGLIAAIRWLAARQLEPAGIAVRLEIEPLEARLPPQAETAVFRAVQEVLANVVRHASASSVLVQVARARDSLVIEVEDDGVGFDLAAVSELGPSGRGLGLLGIRERMELLGGSAKMDSAPGHGTRVVLEAPLLMEPSWLACAS